MEETVREAWRKRALLGISDRVANVSGPCIHDGCGGQGFDLTDELCSTHFVTDVIANMEDVLHEANINWAAACVAESNQKEIWRCTCGFLGTFQERELHFNALHSDASVSHGPPVRNQVVRTTQTRAPSTHKQAIKLGDLG